MNHPSVVPSSSASTPSSRATSGATNLAPSSTVSIPSPSTSSNTSNSAAALQSLFQSHILSSQPHPIATSFQSSNVRFLSSTTGSGPSQCPTKRQTGVRAIYVWPIPATSTVAQEWRKWENHLTSSTFESSAHAHAGSAGDSTNSLPPPTLPATVISTGARWHVVVEHCFLSRASMGGPTSTPMTSASSLDQLHSRIMRVTFTTSNPSLSISTSHHPPEQWLLTHNSIIVGGGLNSLLDSIGSGPLSSSVSTTGVSGGSSEFLQVKASHTITLDEYVSGDFYIRLGTVRQGARVQPIMILELEMIHANGTQSDIFTVLNEFALRLGVQPDHILPSSESLTKASNFGLSMQTYSMGHIALQYCNVMARMKELSQQQQQSQQQQPGGTTPTTGQTNTQQM